MVPDLQRGPVGRPTWQLSWQGGRGARDREDPPTPPPHVATPHVLESEQRAVIACQCTQHAVLRVQGF